MIVDAQVHVEGEFAGAAVGTGTSAAATEPFTIERVLPLMDEAGVNRVIIVRRHDGPSERLWERGGETIFRPLRRYGRFPVDNPRAVDLLPRWKEQSACSACGSPLAAPGGLRTDGGLVLARGQKAGVPVMFVRPGSCRIRDIAERQPQLTLISIMSA